MEKEQFTQKVIEAEKSLYHIAKSILKKDEDCADAMQNAILTAFSKLHTLRNEKTFKTWLTRILINECYMIVRKRKDVVSYEEYMQEESISFEEEYSEVFCEVEKLEEKYRVPFVLHYAEGYSVKEISEMLNISQGNIKTRLYRARNVLRESLKGVSGYEKYRLG